MTSPLAATLRSAAERFADRPALRWEGGTLGYAELLRAVEAFAGRLHELGGAGRRTGILLPNLPWLPVAVHGVLRTGGSVLLLNPLNSPREVSEYLDTSGVGDVVTVGSLVPLLPDATRALLLDDLPKALRVRAAGEERKVPLEGAPRAPQPAVGAEAEAAVLFTAASRGWARGASLSHSNLLANLRSTVDAMRMSSDDVVVAVLPLIHAFGLTVGLNAPLSVGAIVLPVERFHPLRLLELFEEQRATVFAGVPAMFLGLIAAAERRGVPAHSLRLAICGGAPLDPEIARRWEELFGVPLRQGYGLTEAAPVCLFNRVDRPNQIGTLGYPFPGVEVSIRDARGEPLPAGEVGEICVRGENVFGGYLRERGRNPADFHGEWLRTGDLGSQDDDGVVRFRGVLKPMFTRNGFNIYPRELERVLLQHPGVADATVAAQQSAARENDIVVSVRPTPGAALTEDDVREHCRANLAGYKQPTRVHLDA